MATAALVQCTFFANAAPHGGNISSDCSANTSISACIVAASTAGEGVYKDYYSVAAIECTDIFGNAGGDWVGGIDDQYGLNGNICLDPMFCNPGAGDFTLSEGSPCLPEYNPDCGLIGAHPWGCSHPSPVSDRHGDHNRNFLAANYPNPFNPATTIRFGLNESQHARLRIFALDGGLITTLVSGVLDAGQHEAVWQGRDAHGRLVPSGNYIYRLETSAFQMTGRMLLLK